MTATEIVRYANKETGRGRTFSGIYNILLTGYPNGTGFTLSASTFGLNRLMQIMVLPVDCVGLYNFDWNPDPESHVLKIYEVSDQTEIETDEADGKNIRVLYFGF